MDSSAAALPARGLTDTTRWQWAGGLLFVVAVVSWWQFGSQQGSGLGAGLRVNLAVAGALMAASHLGANAIEALAYALWWRSRGARLPYGGFFVGLVALSLVDCVASGLAALAERTPALALWLAPLAGPQLVRARLPGVEPGLWAAFGGLGLLVLSRIIATAWLQAAGTGRRLRAALAVTSLAWLVTRIAVWWSVDLLRGMSPLP